MARDRSLWGILALALALRLIAGVVWEPLTVSGDEANWHGVAKAFLVSGVLHADAGTYWPPLYPLMLAVIYRIFPGGPDAAQVIQAILGTLTCAVLYWVGRRIGGRRAGLGAAALCAVYPFFVLFSAVLMAETLLMFLVVVIMMAFLMATDRVTMPRCALLGLAIGLGVLAKPVVLAWAAFLLPGLWRHGGNASVARAVGVGAVLAIAALTVAPWTLRNYAVTGRFVPVSTNLGMNLVIGAEPRATGVYRHGASYMAMVDSISSGAASSEVARDRAAARQGLIWLVTDPVRTIRLAALKLFWFWGPFIPGEGLGRSLAGAAFYLPVLVLGALGAYRLRGTAVAWGILTLALSLTAVHAVFFAHTLFRLPIDAVLMAPAGWLASRAWRQRGTAVKAESGLEGP